MSPKSRTLAPTDDLLVRTVFPSADIDEVEHSLCSSKSSYELLKIFNLFDRASPYQSVSKAANIGIDSANHAGGEGYVLCLILDPVAHGNVKLRRSTATARFSIANVLIAELAALAS